MTKSRKSSTNSKPFRDMTPVMMPVGQLKSHPKQDELIGNLSDADLEALEADIKRNGLKHPLRVLPDGTIVEGHQRLRAVTHLGWTEVPAIVDHELAAQGEDAIETALIEDNANRRQADKLQLARWAQRLYEIERGRSINELGSYEHNDLRDRVARRLGMKSGRNVSRYMQILRTPEEVQDAFRAEEVTLVEACAVEGLNKAIQEDIAKQIKEGGEPAKVVASYLAKHKPKKVCPNAIFASFVKGIQRDDPVLSRVMKKISQVTADDIASLMRHQKLAARLIAHAKEAKVIKDNQEKMFNGFVKDYIGNQEQGKDGEVA